MIRRFWRDSRGAAALEFGLIAPILFMAVVGVVVLSMHSFKRDQIDEAVRLAVRDVISGDIETQTEIQTAFTVRLGENGFDAVAPRVVIIDETTGKIARVALTWDFDLTIPFVEDFDTAYNVDVDIPI